VHAKLAEQKQSSPVSHMAKQKLTHQFHGLQVKICVSIKYTNKQQADNNEDKRGGAL
jgi:hypothetical protein